MISIFIDWVTLGIELAGIIIIIIGATTASLKFIFSLLRREAKDNCYHVLRANLGRSILIGLEFLVAADIISTVAIEPTLNRVIVLAMIVLIRTFLSFALEVEIEGKLPWKKMEQPENSPSPLNS